MTIQERYGNGAVSGDEKSATIAFWITGHTAWADAYNELYNASVGGGAYGNFNGIPAQKATVDEVSERLGYWNGKVQYGFDTPRGQNPTSGATPELDYSFDTSVRTRIERFRSDGTGWTTIGPIQTAAGEEPVDHDGLGYGGLEKGYEGLEIPRPDRVFNLEYSPTSLNQLQLNTIDAAVGKVNSTTFYNRPPGEVLFAGARGQAKANDRWRLSYQFLTKANRTSVDCGNGITIAAVDGWDIIEVEYKRTTVTIASKQKIIENARQARVLRPFDRTDFQLILYPA